MALSYTSRMFTGIVEATAEVREKSPSGLIVERPVSFEDIKISSSIAVAGVCLTVARLSDTYMECDVVEETWRKTSLADLHMGDRVNVERAMKAGGRLDGHIVQGHVEGTGSVVLQKYGQLIVELPANLAARIVPKGSIAIDGVSLTVANIEENRCIIALIPHTLERTTLGKLAKGDRVNVETDVLMRHASMPQPGTAAP